MEEIDRHRSYRTCSSTEIVNVRTLNENKTEYARPWHLSLDPFPRKEGVVNLTKSTKRSSPSIKMPSWNDPETKRKKRIARYKLYGAEGNIKKSFRWFKRKCTMIIRRF